ncbi:MAG: terminase small subunit [Bacteroidales bacterium]|jgi:phage terminase small subunit
MEAGDKPLTRKEARFCYEYCIDLNATQAAIRAGYSERSARSIGCQNLTKLNVKAQIQKMRNSLEETAGITSLMIVNELKKIARTSIGSIYNTWITLKDFEKLTDDQKACISEIDTKTRTEYQYDPVSDEKRPIKVEYVKIKLYDKLKALDSLTNILGYNAAIRNELSGKIEFEKLSDDQLNEIVFRVLNTGK